jgi:hypothetical protein
MSGAVAIVLSEPLFGRQDGYADLVEVRIGWVHEHVEIP